MAGVKHDSQKPPLDLLPYESLVEVAKVLFAGEHKYGTANWAEGIEMRRLLSAAMRHIGQFNSGEDFDEETETIHLANATANLLFAIWMFKNRPDMDNRWAKNIGRVVPQDEKTDLVGYRPSDLLKGNALRTPNDIVQEENRAMERLEAEVEKILATPTQSKYKLKHEDAEILEICSQIVYKDKLGVLTLENAIRHALVEVQS